MRGALVEYGSDFLGPIPNIVIFQFNPESISRTIDIPGSDTGAGSSENSRLMEPNTASAPPTESFSITAHFSAMNDLGEANSELAIPRVFGIGTHLAALEKMGNTKAGFLSQAIGAAIDVIGDAVSAGNADSKRNTPRESLPKILFIWGPSRVLPVEIKTMTIVEQQYDPFLNPVQAQVEIGLKVSVFSGKTDNPIGKGALIYTNTLKEAQALLNLQNTSEASFDVIPF
ncbi:MAG: hypothetical protein GY819_13085 [Planctomycetaceae bacterium]|nr:hypothetical protein [Planctomycetaceae bacterium]